MAMHKACQPQTTPDSILDASDASLHIISCIMVFEKRCKGNGMVSSSLNTCCEGCSKYYKICEVCGEPL